MSTAVVVSAFARGSATTERAISELGMIERGEGGKSSDSNTLADFPHAYIMW
jgi:hypothetical protein